MRTAVATALALLGLLTLVAPAQANTDCDAASIAPRLVDGPYASAYEDFGSAGLSREAAIAAGVCVDRAPAGGTVEAGTGDVGEAYVVADADDDNWGGSDGYAGVSTFETGVEDADCDGVDEGTGANSGGCVTTDATGSRVSVPAPGVACGDEAWSASTRDGCDPQDLEPQIPPNRGCTHADGVVVPAGSGVVYADADGGAGLSGQAAAAAGACVEDVPTGPELMGGTVEAGAGDPGEAYAVVDGQDSSTGAWGAVGGYAGVSTFESGVKDASCDGSDDGSQTNSGGCMTTYENGTLIPSVSTPAPAVACGNNSGKAWATSDRDGCNPQDFEPDVG